MLVSSTHRSRRTMRRAARTTCQAVGLEGFRLLGERSLDLSMRGMLVACDDRVDLGEEVVVSFKAPGHGNMWMDAEAEVARIIQGYRQGDPGYAVVLRFTYFERHAQQELLARLAGYPPPVPRRRVLTPRDRMSGVPALELSPGTRPVPPVPKGVFRAMLA